MSERNDMMEMANKSSRIIDVFCDALMNTAAVAAEKIELASEIASVRMRMEAFGNVLEIVAAQKEPLLKRLETATGGMRLLLERQVEMLTEQEMAVPVCRRRSQNKSWRRWMGRFTFGIAAGSPRLGA